MKKLLPLLFLVICGIFIPAHAQVVNEVQNPNFARTTLGGSDGSRDWTLVSGLGFCIVQNDLYDNGYPPVTDGSLGYLVERVPGTAPDFEYATSEWTNASAGQIWEAQIEEAPVPPVAIPLRCWGRRWGWWR